VTDPRAIVFDLDDTLYRYRAFVDGGFRAVARAVELEHHVPAASVLRTLRAARRLGRRGRELQVLCAAHAFDTTTLARLVSELVEHDPALRLPSASARVIDALRPTWRVGILTNGSPRVQWRKVAALGLHALVDAVVLAEEHGARAGKPDPGAFAAVLRRLGVGPDRAVCVGDNPLADVAGARAAGMFTIHFQPRPTHAAVPGADACVRRLSEVPAVADRLVPARCYSHAC
jgi:putative hydrolase of the HAD superfamily